MISKLQKQVIRYFTFIVGASQVVLSVENSRYWNIIQILGDLQILSLLFVMDLNQHIETQNILVYLSLPTANLIMAIDDHTSSILIMIAILSIMHIITILQIRQQSSNYQIQKENRSNLAQDSIQAKFEKLTQIYGYSDYMNIWFQINIKSKSTNLNMTRLVVHWFNAYMVIINKPVAIYAFYVLVNGQTTIELILAAILLTFNTLNYIICYNIQKIALTVSASNFLKLRSSFIHSLEQLIEHVVIVWVVLEQQQNTVTIILLSLVFILNIAEFFYSMPYTENYKRLVIIMTNCTCLIITLTQLDDIQGDQIQLTLILVPFMVRILYYLAYYQLYDLISIIQYLKSQQQWIQIKIPSQLELESIMHQVKIYAIGSLQSLRFTYFPQLLRLINHSQLRNSQILIMDSDMPKQLNPIVSKLLLHAGILFQQHSQNCQSIYCYCRGMKGETLKGTQRSVNICNMFSNEDLEISSINIYTDLIHRYIRNHCKSVFQTYQGKSDITNLVQLVSYLADSEECIQSIVTIMDLISKLEQTKQQLTWYENIAIGITAQYVQFNILVKYNNTITPPQMDTTFQYEYFRAVYKKSLKIFRKFVECIKAKQLYYTSLDYQQTYESMELQIRRLNGINQSTQEQLQKFMMRTQSKTALLCHLIFEFEIKNNYIAAEKILQQLKGTESKFFEFPDIYYDMEEHSMEVCYVRVDLGSSAINEQYNGTKRGWIKEYSSSAPNYFQYSASEFAKLRNIVQLMPYSTQCIHDDFIDIFLLTSRPNVIRVHIPLFIKTQSDELILSEFFADFDFKFPDGQLTIYVFLKKIKNTASVRSLKQYFWVDQYGNLEAVSQNVFSTFRIADPENQWLYNQTFSTIMPEFQEAQTELEQNLKDFLDSEELKKGKVAESKSRTLDSLQIVHSKQLQNTSLNFPKQIIIGEKDLNYIVDCQIYLKQAQLLGRLYKVYLIQIDNYAVEQTDISSFYQREYIEQPEIPGELESEDSKYLEILAQQLQFSSPDKSFTSGRKNQSEIAAEEIIQYGHIQQQNQSDIRQFQSNSQLNQNQVQDNYELYGKGSLSSMRQGLSMSQRQQLYFQDNLIIHNNSLNRSVSQPIDQVEANKQTSRIREEMLIMNENHSQSSQATTQGKFKILSKSTLYTQFAESQQTPSSVVMITALNIFMLIILFILIIVSLSILEQLNNRFSNETHLLRSTLGSDFVLNVAQYIWNAEVTFMEQTQQNIGIIMDQLGQKISHQHMDFYDAIDNTTYPITLWTFFFYLRYYYIQMDDPDKYQETITFFLKNYMSYDDWIDTTNGEVYESIEQSIIVLNTTITICIIVQLSVFMLYTLLLICLVYQYIQLIKRILRCCQQISYQSLVSDLQYYDKLLYQFIQRKESNRCYFNLYDHQTDYQEKLRIVQKYDKQNTKQSESTQQRNQMILKMQQQGTKKNLTIKQSWNYKTYIIIPLNLICSTIFLITYVASMLDLVSFKDKLDQDLKIFSEIVVLQEQFLEIVFSNNVINDKFEQILDEEELELYYELLDDSWEEYHELMSGLLRYDSQLAMKLTAKLNEELCPIKSCGLDIMFQHAQSMMLKHISESQFEGYNFDADDIFIITHIQNQFTNLLDESEVWLKAQTQTQYDFTLLMLSALGGIILFIQIIQTIQTHYQLNNRFQQVKQFVYLMPTGTLYLEDSFYKTLHYISLKEKVLLE